KTGHLGEQKRHLVAKGETWWSIAHMYGLGVADLARANGAVPTDTLVEGRELTLVVPPIVVERQVPVEVEKPTVPPAVDATVKEKTTLWSWLTGLVSSGGLGLGWLAGMDGQAITAIGGVVLVFLFVLLLLRRQIVSAVKEIREGLA